MTGSSLPYHLRPHKAVDRRLFIDLLSRIERWKPLHDYVYLSMGAYPLEDHKLVHRVLGLKRLVAFDYDDAVVARQKFNRPLQTCHCIKEKSGDVIRTLDDILNRFHFSDAAGVICWLDYTSPKQIGAQIQEFQALLDKSAIGDVVRVTINAHPHELDEQQTGAPIPVEEKRQRQFETLKRRIGDFLPSTSSADDMTPLGLARVLSEAFGAAALAALPVTGDKAFRPLSIVRYADGQQMLSITGVVASRGDEGEMLARLSLDSWPFASNDWVDIHQLVVPDLTVRERLFLEREVTTRPADEIIQSLGFEQAGDIAIADFIDSYKNYYRFYPTLLSSDL